MSALRVLISINIVVSASTNSSLTGRQQRSFTPPAAANTSLSVRVGTKAVLSCLPVTSTAVQVTTWEITLRDQPACTRAYRRDTNETRAKNCSDETISWDTRHDQNPVLQIDPVAITHDGYYRCEVATPEGNFYQGYHLQVTVPPEATLFRGKNGTVVCRAAAGRPAAQISWTPAGDCDTEEEPLGNDTVTVQSTCLWEDHPVSTVSCSVSHLTGNESLSIELIQGVLILKFPASTLLIILYVKFSLFLVILVMVGLIYFQGIKDRRIVEQTQDLPSAAVLRRGLFLARGNQQIHGQSAHPHLEGRRASVFTRASSFRARPSMCPESLQIF
ncbi:cell surface glycoprotein CD200 receptor 2-like, partial [Hyaena hyaena]|uniref:cell surface glycoprotein CD200 receptor 2-like n=1 Tax=Hyaena hyaena TaxID=95912 RepID=UPI0019231DEC